MLVISIQVMWIIFFWFEFKTIVKISITLIALKDQHNLLLLDPNPLLYKRRSMRIAIKEIYVIYNLFRNHLIQSMAFQPFSGTVTLIKFFFRRDGEQLSISNGSSTQITPTIKLHL